MDKINSAINKIREDREWDDHQRYEKRFGERDRKCEELIRIFEEKRDGTSTGLSGTGVKGLSKTKESNVTQEQEEELNKEDDYKVRALFAGSNPKKIRSLVRKSING